MSKCRIIHHLVLSFTLCYGISGQSLHQMCSTPKITSRTPHVSVYRLKNTAKATVHYCIYKEDRTCSSHTCRCHVFDYYPLKGQNSSYKYSDISSSCLNSNTADFVDKFGTSDHKGEPSTYNCSGGNRLVRIITANHSTLEAEVDLTNDEIAIRKGVICRYSAGFCQDEDKDIDFVWNTTEPLHAGREILQEIRVEDAYIFTLAERKYSVIQSRSKYFVLELLPTTWDGYKKYLRTTTIGIAPPLWKTDEGFLISEGRMVFIDNLIIGATEDLGFYFTNRQELYYYLAAICQAFITDTSSSSIFAMLFKKIIKAEIKIERQSKSLEELSARTRQFEDRAMMFFYSIISLALFSTALAFISLYSSCKRSFKFTKIISNDAISKPVANVGDMYDYITSEYEINTVYDKK